METEIVQPPPLPPPPHNPTENSHTNPNYDLILERLKSRALLRLNETDQNIGFSSDIISIVERRLREAFPAFRIPSHPPYASMIQTAIVELNEKGGSSESAISEYIRANNDDLPWAHNRYLSHHLEKLIKNGEIARTRRGCYLIPREGTDNEDEEEGTFFRRGKEEYEEYEEEDEDEDEDEEDTESQVFRRMSRKGRRSRKRKARMEEDEEEDKEDNKSQVFRRKCHGGRRTRRRSDNLVVSDKDEELLSMGKGRKEVEEGEEEEEESEMFRTKLPKGRSRRRSGNLVVSDEDEEGSLGGSDVMPQMAEEEDREEDVGDEREDGRVVEREQLQYKNCEDTGRDDFLSLDSGDNDGGIKTNSSLALPSGPGDVNVDAVEPDHEIGDSSLMSVDGVKSFVEANVGKGAALGKMKKGANLCTAVEVITVDDSMSQGTRLEKSTLKGKEQNLSGAHLVNSPIQSQTPEAAESKQVKQMSQIIVCGLCSPRPRKQQLVYQKRNQSKGVRNKKMPLVKDKSMPPPVDLESKTINLQRNLTLIDTSVDVPRQEASASATSDISSSVPVVEVPCNVVLENQKILLLSSTSSDLLEPVSKENNVDHRTVKQMKYFERRKARSLVPSSKLALASPGLASMLLTERHESEKLPEVVSGRSEESTSEHQGQSKQPKSFFGPQYLKFQSLVANTAALTGSEEFSSFNIDQGSDHDQIRQEEQESQADERTAEDLSAENQDQLKTQDQGNSLSIKMTGCTLPLDEQRGELRENKQTELLYSVPPESGVSAEESMSESFSIQNPSDIQSFDNEKQHDQNNIPDKVSCVSEQKHNSELLNSGTAKATLDYPVMEPLTSTLHEEMDDEQEKRECSVNHQVSERQGQYQDHKNTTLNLAQCNLSLDEQLRDLRGNQRTELGDGVPPVLGQTDQDNMNAPLSTQDQNQCIENQKQQNQSNLAEGITCGLELASTAKVEKRSFLDDEQKPESKPVTSGTFEATSPIVSPLEQTSTFYGGTEYQEENRECSVNRQISEPATAIDKETVPRRSQSSQWQFQEPQQLNQERPIEQVENFEGSDRSVNVLSLTQNHQSIEQPGPLVIGETAAIAVLGEIDDGTIACPDLETSKPFRTGVLSEKSSPRTVVNDFATSKLSSVCHHDQIEDQKSEDHEDSESPLPQFVEDKVRTDDGSIILHGKQPIKKRGRPPKQKDGLSELDVHKQSPPHKKAKRRKDGPKGGGSLSVVDQCSQEKNRQSNKARGRPQNVRRRGRPRNQSKLTTEVGASASLNVPHQYQKETSVPGSDHLSNQLHECGKGDDGSRHQKRVRREDVALTGSDQRQDPSEIATLSALENPSTVCLLAENNKQGSDRKISEFMRTSEAHLSSDNLLHEQQRKQKQCDAEGSCKPDTASTLPSSGAVWENRVLTRSGLKKATLLKPLALCSEDELHRLERKHECHQVGEQVHCPDDQSRHSQSEVCSASGKSGEAVTPCSHEVGQQFEPKEHGAFVPESEPLTSPVVGHLNQQAEEEQCRHHQERQEPSKSQRSAKAACPQVPLSSKNVLRSRCKSQAQDGT